MGLNTGAPALYVAPQCSQCSIALRSAATVRQWTWRQPSGNLRLYYCRVELAGDIVSRNAKSNDWQPWASLSVVSRSNHDTTASSAVAARTEDRLAMHCCYSHYRALLFRMSGSYQGQPPIVKLHSLTTVVLALWVVSLCPNLVPNHSSHCHCHCITAPFMSAGSMHDRHSQARSVVLHLKTRLLHHPSHGHRTPHPTLCLLPRPTQFCHQIPVTVPPCSQLLSPRLRLVPSEHPRADPVSSGLPSPTPES